MTNEVPVITRTYKSPVDFVPSPGSAYICGRSAEERSEHHSAWSKSTSDVRVCEVISEERDRISISLGSHQQVTLSLRSQVSLSAFWSSLSETDLYLDITGLRHSTWAALLRGLILDSRRVRVVYVEPTGYRMSPQPTENEIYDLSEKIEGIGPLPGYARLRRDSAAGLFVPLLGFEGTRFQHILNQVEPPGQKVYPIVGVPGFRAEYPFITYWANRTALRESQAWKKVRYAPANCPFCTLNVLSRMHREHDGESITMAPIGTKPQALAAVVYSLQHPGETEIVYDHPVRKARRTEGVSQLHVYDMTGLLTLK